MDYIKERARWLRKEVGELSTLLADKDKPLQIGGTHYKDMTIQPLQFIQANNLGFLEGNIIKYVCRHKNKGKQEDLHKALHYLYLLLEKEYPDAD